jgi:multidrug efflux pump subunit AcrB
VLERVEAVRKTLPAGVQLDVVRNTGHNVELSVGQVQEALLEGALL